MKRRHRPLRSCLGCGVREDPADMVRITVDREGELQIGRRQPGRGGYLHKREECWEGFLRRKSLFRAFRAEVEREARERLVQKLANISENR